MDTKRIKRDKSGCDISHATNASSPSRALVRWSACAGGVVLWITCAAFDATVDTRFDEPVVGRLMRRWTEHPLRVMAAGTLATWALGGLVAGAPAAAPPAKGGADDG